MKTTNKIFTALGFIVLVCGVLNILNPIIRNNQFMEFAVAYLVDPAVPVVAIALIAIGLGMMVKGLEK